MSSGDQPCDLLWCSTDISFAVQLPNWQGKTRLVCGDIFMYYSCILSLHKYQMLFYYSWQFWELGYLLLSRNKCKIIDAFYYWIKSNLLSSLLVVLTLSLCSATSYKLQNTLINNSFCSLCQENPIRTGLHLNIFDTPLFSISELLFTSGLMAKIGSLAYTILSLIFTFTNIY